MLQKSALATRIFARRRFSFSSMDGAFSALLKIARISESVNSKVFIALSVYREPARAVAFYLEPDTKVQSFF